MFRQVKKVLAILLLGLGFIFPTLADDISYYPAQKVVYHINYINQGMRVSALDNIQNHLNSVGEKNMELVVVLHGPGLSLLLKPEALERVNLDAAHADEEVQALITKLKSQNVKFKVCINTIKHYNINYKEDLFDVSEQDIVPSGIAEVARLQSMGYIYIKP